MKIILEFARWFVIGFTVALSILFLSGHEAQAEDSISALPTRDGKILISKHDFLVLQQFIFAQQKEIKEDEDQSDFWRERYGAAEECVREQMKASAPVMLCFNDLEI